MLLQYIMFNESIGGQTLLSLGICLKESHGMGLWR